jgi:hypothetical protein
MSEPLRTLGRYALKRRLAAGGMGEVYLGEVQGAANFTKQVAIKRILPHLAANEAFVAKFIDEANVTVQLHHGNIVPVLELTDEGGELFIVMEYLPGRDLKAVLHRLKAQRRTFPVDLALFVAGEICDGLDYAHRRTGSDGHPLHIVHRDVSPSNVMLGAAGEVKLVDFGIARARGSLHQSISGHAARQVRVHEPRAGRGSARRCTQRHLFDRTRSLRDADRVSAPRGRLRNRDAAPGPAGPHRAPLVPAAGRPARGGCPGPEGARPGPGGPSRHRGRHATRNVEPSWRARQQSGRCELDAASVSSPRFSRGRRAAARGFTAVIRRRAVDAARWHRQPAGEARAPRARRPSGRRPSGASAERARVAGRTPTGPQSRTPTAFARTAAGGSEEAAEDSDAASLDRADARKCAGARRPDARQRRDPRHVRPPPHRPPGRSGLDRPARPAQPARARPARPALPLGQRGQPTGPTDRSTIPATATDRPPTTRPTAPAGRRRTLILGLLIGLGIAAVATLWPRDATLRPQITPDLADAWIEVDGARLSDGATLVAGRPYRICATAPDHAPDCRQITLSAGQNRPAFELTPAPVLAPIIEPADLDARLTLDGVEIRQPRFPLIAGQSYAVCASAPGYTEACERFAATAGVNAPRLALTPLTPADAAVPDAATDAATDTSTPDAAPDAAPRRRGKPPVRSVTLDSPVTAEVWTADRHLGATPLEVRVEARPITYELRAEGYSPTRYTIAPDHRGGPIRIAAPAPRPPHRARPPARLRDPARRARSRARTSAGARDPNRAPHTLTIRFLDRLSPVRQIEIEPGKTLELPAYDLSPPPEDRAADGVPHP